ncbi:MAG TPA: AAA family ATPase [Chthonomonadaceae bacterium]|nr:AAA family ATPase [Chthonomonadaceae bacterium]
MTNVPVETTEEALHRGMQRARVYDWGGAVEAFRKAVALDPENVEARFRLGWALWNQAEADKPTLADMAVAYGAQVLGFDQTARDGKRKFQTYRQRLNDAIFYLRSVIERDENRANAYYYLGKALYALDRRTEAEEASRKAAMLDPANSTYRDFAQSFEQGAVRALHSVDESKLTWEDLVLNPRTKRELKQMQYMLEKPDLARQLGVQTPTGILLKGPPGTGKTTIARILANEAKCNFHAITPADIHQMYVGESEKRVRDLFAKARANPPAIIFIDEIDALLPIRQGGIAIHSDKVVNQFLQEMDGLTPNNRVFIVGATNRPDMLDPALRRGGRLSREIEIPMPDLEARKQLFALCTRRANLAPDVDLEALARQTEGYSGADIKALVNEAGLQALIRIADSKDQNVDKTLTMADFTSALENLG